MQIIACYSNKGGVGKTAAAVNLAYEAAQSGLRVLLCDLDPQGASSFYFRVKPSTKLKQSLFFRDQGKFQKAIRGSDFENLDILPANMSYRDFDVFLANMKKGRSRLRKVLAAGAPDYDLIVLDCPPNISTLSEGVFRAADRIVVPIIPTTLSERTFGQFLDFIADDPKVSKKKALGFFSMTQARKTLHGETMKRMREEHGKMLLDAVIPFAVDVENMGLHRSPVATYAGAKASSAAYRALWSEIRAKLAPIGG
jgi:chromosome partitioning protein